MAIRDLTARIRITADTRQANQALGQTEKSVGSFGSAFFKAAASITAAVGTVSVAFNQLREGATLAAQERALETQLGRIGQSLQGFVQELKSVSENTISTADLISSSSRALLLGIPAEEISSLLEIARKSAQATGQSISEAFNDITTGIGRASPLILDNLGITVKIGAANEKYAASLGKTVEQLTAAETKQALLNAVLKQGETSFDGLDKAVSPVGKELDRLNANWDDLIDGTSKGAASSSSLATAFRFLADQVNFLRVSLLNALTVFGVIPQVGRETKEVLKETAETTDDVTEATQRSTGAYESFVDALKDSLSEAARGVGQQEQLQAQTEETTQTQESWTESVDDTTVSLREERAELIQVRTEMERTGQQAVITAVQFDALSRSAGRAAAEQAAIDSGAEVILGGTRVRLRGGGSRLVRTRTTTSRTGTAPAGNFFGSTGENSLEVLG